MQIALCLCYCALLISRYSPPQCSQTPNLQLTSPMVWHYISHPRILKSDVLFTIGLTRVNYERWLLPSIDRDSELWQVTATEYRQRHQVGRTMNTSGRTTRHGRHMIRKLRGYLYKSQYVCHWLILGPALPHSLLTSVSTLQIGLWDPEQQDKHALKSEATCSRVLHRMRYSLEVTES
jgi:hypothetical protein